VLMSTGGNIDLTGEKHGAATAAGQHLA